MAATPIPPPPGEKREEDELVRRISERIGTGFTGISAKGGARPVGTFATGISALPPERRYDPTFPRWMTRLRDIVRPFAQFIDPETGMPEVDIGVISGIGKRLRKAMPPEEEILNFRRIAISPQEEENLRKAAAATAREHKLLPKEVEAQKDIDALARQIDPAEIDRQATSGVGPMGRAARHSMRLRMNSLNKEVVQSRNAISNLATTEEAMSAERNLMRMEKDLDEYILKFSGIRSEMGRNLVALRMEADATIDVGYWMSKARREAGLPPGTHLPERQATPIREAIVKAQDALASGDDAAAKAAKEQLIKEVQSLRQDGWLETAIALRKAGLLTGIRTHMRNIFGNAGFQVMEEASRLPASAVDVGLSIFTGKRTVDGMSPGFFNAIGATLTKEGRRKGKSILQGGENLQKYEMLRGLNSPSPLINGYVNSVFKAMSYEDQLFKTYAIHRSLEDQARTSARNAGLTGKHFKARVQQLKDSPTEEMAIQAVTDAEFATFNNPNRIATFISKGQVHGLQAAKAFGKDAETSARILNAVIDLTIPFKRTPANIVARVIDYTPVGTAVKVPTHAVRAMIEGSLSPARQKAISEAVGRGAIGSATILLGYYLAKDGKMTGIVEESSGRRGTAAAAGQRVGAVRIGDQWLGIETFSPLGNLMTIGATMHREGIGITDLLGIAGIAGKTVSEQPVLTGMEEFTRAIQRPVGAGKKIASSYVSSFVPIVVGDIARLTDPEQVLRRGEGIAEEVKRKVPGLREDIPVRRDVFWDPIKTKPSGFVDPFLTTPQTDDPAKAETARLRIGITYPRRGKEESREAYHFRSGVHGRLVLGAVRSVVNNRDYASLGDLDKKYNITRAVRSAQNMLGRLRRDHADLTEEQKIADLKDKLTVLEKDPEGSFNFMRSGLR